MAEEDFEARPIDHEALGVDGFGALELGKRVDGFAGLFVGEAEVVEGLQIEPELDAGAEEVSETQGRIAGDRAGAVQDLGDAVGRHAELACKFSCAHIESVQFFGEVFARVNGGGWHGGLLNGRPFVHRIKEPAGCPSFLRAGRRFESRTAHEEERRPPWRESPDMLGAAADFHPFEEAFHAGAFAPH